ncbi:MAG: hypothetical protein HC848_06155 [Limnobacter sp.]|nr:hypothetical protein [Limnobacter sp.]
MAFDRVRTRFSLRQQIVLLLLFALLLILGVAGLVSYQVALHEADESSVPGWLLRPVCWKVCWPGR